MSYTPSKVVVTNHARDRYAQRVIGSKAGVGPLIANEVYEDIDAFDDDVREHFDESLPCSAVPTSRQDAKARIHPETYTVWIFADGWDDRDHVYVRRLITCYAHIPGESKILLGNMLMCGAVPCARLYYPDGDGCPHCGAPQSDAMRVDDRMARWCDTSNNTRSGRYANVLADV